jgi:hypothetical protein
MARRVRTAPRIYVAYAHSGREHSRQKSAHQNFFDNTKISFDWLTNFDNDA